MLSCVSHYSMCFSLLSFYFHFMQSLYFPSFHLASPFCLFISSSLTQPHLCVLFPCIYSSLLFLPFPSSPVAVLASGFKLLLSKSHGQAEDAAFRCSWLAPASDHYLMKSHVFKVSALKKKQMVVGYCESVEP